MAAQLDWDQILNDRYATFKIEETAFIESLQIANSNDIAAQCIYEAIKDKEDIPENLTLMYREAIFGSNTQVRKRIRNRMGNIRRNMK